MSKEGGDVFRILEKMLHIVKGNRGYFEDIGEDVAVSKGAGEMLHWVKGSRRCFRILEMLHRVKVSSSCFEDIG